MEVFECRGCGTALTAPLSRVAFPLYAGLQYGNGVAMPVLMASGTYGVDEDPDGRARSIVIAPGDAHGTDLVQRRELGACCGIDGRYGPNVTCAGCGGKVATRIDDCSLWQATWLVPAAVRPVPAGPARPVEDWATVTDRRRAAGLSEADGRRSIRWDVEAAVTLAHLVFAAGDAPLAPAAGPLAQAFRPLLGQLPPPATLPSAPARRAVLAGPGRPLSDPLPDIAVVPRHPRTGESWPTPPGVAVAPLAAEFWTSLAFRDQRELAPATGGLPPGVERDDPLPPHSRYAPYLDRWVFRSVLNRLNGVAGTADDCWW
ncbi:hypothetical protein ABTZ03_17395 [Kitasatospora sp. NPDC096077]|uniref:hypothetical protein n=1 Tax=Kitasatospora sp. NPDC096077 TaxID=3155544 RepID=UPI003327BE9C